MPIETAHHKNVIPRAYYHANSTEFLSASEAEIYRDLVHNSMQFDLTAQQEMAWSEEIRILRSVAECLGDCHIAFEYTIPRMGKRIDAVIIKNSLVFLLEFKVFENHYPQNAIDQVLDYALDLQNFHEMSHTAVMIPVVVCTCAPKYNNTWEIKNNITSVLRCNEATLADQIAKALNFYVAPETIDPNSWINSIYKPTPTIIEAAQALYAGHDV